MNNPHIITDSNRLASIAAIKDGLEYLATRKYPRQNWDRFISIMATLPFISEEEITRWNEIRHRPYVRKRPVKQKKSEKMSKKLLTPTKTLL